MTSTPGEEGTWNQPGGAAAYIGAAITFALVDFILPLALAVEIGHRVAAKAGGTPSSKT